MESLEKPSRHGQRGYMVAVVLGTALSALGASAGVAAETGRTVADISRYCTTCWRNAHFQPDCWNDCTQEVFSRLLERVAAGDLGRILQSEGEERREFLRAIDAVKKRTQRARKWSAGQVETVTDRHDIRERRLRDDRQAVQQAAAELLSARQQRVLQLSFEGWTVADIASELQSTPERISDEKYKAICKLRERLSREEA